MHKTIPQSIIITDLTRFKKGNPKVCIAGIDPNTGECIRPMPYIDFEFCRKNKIQPGGILTANFRAHRVRVAPHTEDSSYENLRYDGPCSGDAFRSVLETNCYTSVEKGFGATIPRDCKVISKDQRIGRSIITVRVKPVDIRIEANRFEEGKIKLHLDDASGRNYGFLPITDLGFHDYAQEHRDPRSLANLNKSISEQEDVFVRIGLSRFYEASGKSGYWLQANGIYTFPLRLGRVRSYP